MRKLSSLLPALAPVLMLAQAPAGAQEARPDASRPLVYSAWAKLCTTDAASGNQTCLTGREGHLDASVIGATLVETEGTPDKVLRVTLPLGLQLRIGTRLIIDQSQPIIAPYVSCTSRGCTADHDASAEMIGRLRDAQAITIQAINAAGKPLSFIVPMQGFAEAYDGQPTDASRFADEETRPQAAPQAAPDSLPRLLALSRPLPVLRLTPEQQASLVFSPWRKFCSPGQDGRQVCLTARLARVASASIAVGATFIDPEGAQKKILRVTLPLGLRLQPGTRIAVDAGEPLPASYVICLANGCMADLDASGDLLATMKSGQNLVVQGFNADGETLTAALPLGEFAAVHDGPGIDPKAAAEGQKALQEALQRRAEDARRKLTDQPLNSSSSGP